MTFYEDIKKTSDEFDRIKTNMLDKVKEDIQDDANNGKRECRILLRSHFNRALGREIKAPPTTEMFLLVLDYVYLQLTSEGFKVNRYFDSAAFWMDITW